ncbi:MAG TPA: hypothetical protein DCL54_14630 [Alphaproteobacteria bacterium]|nr:hypothetical protein [Alphaproteobacteria bacterium]HAJ47806.1 hypothetical protein [Alphaproteobacteria bacterium]
MLAKIVKKVKPLPATRSKSNPRSVRYAAEQAPLYAVLTGDIVQSNKLSVEELDEAMASLRHGASTAAKAFGHKAWPFMRFRGDGWQIVMPEPKFALRACLLLRAALHQHKPRVRTRISAGIGSAGRIYPRDLGKSDGLAFNLSGQALERMGRKDAIQLSFVPRDREVSQLVHAVVTLCDAISRRWMPGQARVLAKVLLPEPHNQMEIGRALGITQQSVHAQMDAGNGWALGECLETLESLDWTQIAGGWEKTA